MPDPTSTTPERVDVVIDVAMYEMSVIQTTAHRFTETHFVDILLGHGTATLRLTSKTAALRFPELASEVRNALLDDALRARVVSETKSIRDDLVRTAFACARAASRSPSDGRA